MHLPSTNVCTTNNRTLTLPLGNPFVVESLFIDAADQPPSHCYKSKAWQWLERHRKRFLTKDAVREYLKYIHNHLDIHQQNKLPWKRIYHTLRLAFQLREIIEVRKTSHTCVCSPLVVRVCLMSVRSDILYCLLGTGQRTYCVPSLRLATTATTTSAQKWRMHGRRIPSTHKTRSVRN